MSIFYMNLKKKKLRNWITDNYFEFLFSLENILKRHIDLVPAEKLKNPYLLRQINNEKIKIYG